MFYYVKNQKIIRNHKNKMYFLSYKITQIFSNITKIQKIYMMKKKEQKPNKKENPINYIISVFKGGLNCCIISMNRFGRSRG